MITGRDMIIQDPEVNISISIMGDMSMVSKKLEEWILVQVHEKQTQKFIVDSIL
jgi:hypothetical protein